MSSEDLFKTGRNAGHSSRDNVLARIHEWDGGAESLLSDANASFRTLADTLPQLVSILDAEGEARWYNKAWYEFTGTTPDEVEGGGWRAVQHPEHVDCVVERVQRSVQSGTSWEAAVPLRARDGTYHWFLTRFGPIRDEHGRITALLATGTPMTGFAGAELLPSADAGQPAERAAVGLFHWKHNGMVTEANDAFCRMLGVTQADVRTGAVNLRLCTPREWRELDARKELELTTQGATTSWEKEFLAADGARVPVVVAAAPLAGEPGSWSGVCVDMRTRAPDDRSDDATARRAALGMSRLVRDAVEVARIQTGTLTVHRECVEVRPFLAGIVGMYEIDARARDVALSFEMDSSAPARMSADRLQLAQAIASLLDNAMRFTPGGGEVRLGVRGTGLRETHVEIAVQDSGPGIAAPDLKQILDRSRQPGRASAGPGFGLAIAAGIVEAHGGMLHADSELGSGTTVVLTLPVAPPRDVRNDDASAPGRPTPTRMLAFPGEHPPRSE